MLQIQNALGILSSQVPTGNLLWVDQINGVDALATRGRLTIPFKTLTAAKTAAQSGDTIMVLPGTYTDSNLLKDGVNWHFLVGAIVSATGTIFSTGGGGGVTCMVTGHGDFSCSSGNVVNVAAGNVRIEAKRLSAVDVVSLTGGESIIRCETIETSSGFAIYVSGGSHIVYAHRIQSDDTSAVTITGGSAIITAYEIYTAQVTTIYHSSSSASLTIRHARIISDSGEPINLAVAGSVEMKLVGCFLKGGGSYSITASGAVSVQLLGGTSATQDVETADVTKIGDLPFSGSFT